MVTATNCVDQADVENMHGQITNFLYFVKNPRAQFGYKHGQNLKYPKQSKYICDKA